MPRRRLPPDKRPKWNDPDLKAMAFSNRKGWVEVTEYDRHGICAHNMDLPWQAQDKRPYYLDPTYNLDPNDPNKFTNKKRRRVR